MKSATDIASEMDEGLALLFQRGLDLALQVQADAMAAEAPGDRARLALGFHRLSRSVRQTAALRLRLAREAEQAGREADAQVVRLDDLRRSRRKAQAKAAVERLVWSEYEPNEAEAESLLERLDLILAAEAETDDFLAEDPVVQLARLCDAIDYEIPQAPSPLVGEGVGRSPADEGSHGDLNHHPSANPYRSSA